MHGGLMARVAVKIAVDNLKESGIEPNIWRLIEHFEDAEADIRVIEEESEFVTDTSALLMLDMSLESARQLYQYQGNSTHELIDGQVVELQKLMQETIAIQMQGPIFNDPSFDKSKLRVFARRLQVTVDINNEILHVAGTWVAIAKFRQILHKEISNFLKSSKTTFQENERQKSAFGSTGSANNGVIHLGSLSNDVLALMQKCGIYKHDHMIYDTERGCVVIECPGDENTASKIAEEFQTEYRQIMMGGKLKEYSFSIIGNNNQQSVDELVKQFNNDYAHSVFKFDQESKVIKCLSMSAHQMTHIKTKAKNLLEKFDAVPTTASDAPTDIPTSMSITIPGGRRITLKHANIVMEEVDVIVNAANERLDHVGGVAAAINKASQNVVQALSTNLMQQHGRPLETSQAVFTAAGGTLKCKYIIHTVGPEGYKHGDQCQHLLWMACMNTLQLAEKLKAVSLAIPPISTGIYQVAKDLVARTITQAVGHYPHHDEGLLQDIRIVIIDKDTYDAFKPAFVEMKANCNAGILATQPTNSLQQSLSWPNGDNDFPAAHKVCKNPLQAIIGNQPEGGKMSYQSIKSSLPGHDGFNTIKIIYYIPSGVQGPNHPHPGRQFTGDTRYAYLPDSPEGKEVLSLLQRAFEAKLIFTVGRSATSNKANTIIWNNDIHHKTCRDGGPQYYGYPDHGYLKRVKAQLQQKGIY